MTKLNTYRKYKSGFTLLETLVTLSIVGIIAAFGVNFLSTIIKDGSKASVTSEIKQNGNYAMDVMTFYIRNASAIEQCDGGNSITIRNGIDSIVFSLSARDSSLNSRVASNSTSLTNADKDSGVNVTSLSFTCDQTKNPPTVSIDMDIAQSYWVTRPESSATINFSSNVSLRTY